MNRPYIDLVLEAEAVRLRAWRPSDAQWYVEARDDLIYQFTTERPTLTLEETIAAINAANQSSSAVCLAITDQESGALLGNLYIALEQEHQTGEIGYWLAKDARGRGIATTAVKLLSAWARQQLPLKSLWLKAITDNHTSRKVAERAGFHEITVEEVDGVMWTKYEFRQDDRAIYD